jgi:hypothetical protein
MCEESCCENKSLQVSREKREEDEMNIKKTEERETPISECVY